MLFTVMYFVIRLSRKFCTIKTINYEAILIIGMSINIGQIHVSQLFRNSPRYLCQFYPSNVGRLAVNARWKNAHSMKC